MLVVANRETDRMTESKPITPLTHGLVHYGTVASLFAASRLLPMPKKARHLYRLLGANLGVYNAFTDHGAVIVPLIPFKTHCRLNFFNLLGAGLLGFSTRIRTSALAFHFAFTTIAALNMLLTKVPAGINHHSNQIYIFNN